MDYLRYGEQGDGSGFTGVDMLCEVKPWQSPYIYCSGNFVNRTDPTGLYDYPEGCVVVTAPATKKNKKNNYNYGFQQLLDDANRNRPQMPRITPPTPTFNLPINPNANSVVINNKDSKKDNGTLQNISDALTAAGIAADGCSVVVENEAGVEIVYVTLKGTLAAVQSTKVLKVLKGIGNATIVLGILIDGVHAAVDPSFVNKFKLNTSVAVVAYIVGGVVSAPAGLVIGGGYLVLDQTGFLSPHLKQPNYQRPICPQDNTQIQTPYKY